MGVMDVGEDGRLWYFWLLALFFSWVGINIYILVLFEVGEIYFLKFVLFLLFFGEKSSCNRVII